MVSYLIPALLLLRIWISPFAEYISLSNKEDAMRTAAIAEAMPDVSKEEIVQRIEKAQTKIKVALRNPDEYFKILSELYAIEALANVLEYKERQEHGLSEESGEAVGILFRIGLIKSRFGLAQQPEFFADVTDRSVIDAARAKHLVYADSFLNQEVDISYVSFWYEMFWAYVFTALIVAPVFFVIRLLRRRLRVHLEPHRLVFFSTFWLYGFFVYPTNITREKQFKDLMRFISYLLTAVLSSVAPGAFASPAKMAQSVKNTSAPQEQVIEEGELVSFSDTPLPQLLPTAHVGGADLNAFGWAQYSFDRDDWELDFQSLRIRTTADWDNAGIFFDGNFTDSPKIMELKGWYETESGLKIEIGRLFRKAALAVPPPFLQETIQTAGIPVDFFAPGVAFSGPINESWSFAFDITGESGHPFDELRFAHPEFSGYLKYGFENGFTRLSLQAVEGSTRTFLDAVAERGDHKLRGAVHWNSDGNEIGAYAFYRKKILSWLYGYGQVEHLDGEDSVLGGLRIVSPGNNVALTLEQNFTTGEFGGRMVVRF